MELIIKQEAQGENKGFTVRVDTERKNFKEGDIYCGYVVGFPDPEDRAKYAIHPYWYLGKISSDKMGKLIGLVNKHYRVIEIYGEV